MLFLYTLGGIAASCLEGTVFE